MQDFKFIELNKAQLYSIVNYWEKEIKTPSRRSFLEEFSSRDAHNVSSWAVYTGMEYSVQNVHSFFKISTMHGKNACKNLDIFFSPYKFDPDSELTESQVEYFVELMFYHFDAFLQITHEVEKMNTCKIHSNDQLIALVFSKFAEKLDTNIYQVKYYRNWIEIIKI